MSDKFIVHDRVGIKGQPVPVDENSFINIPEEYSDDLDTIQKLATELEDARHELGRLCQIQHHLINVCNMTEKKLADAKKNIIENMGLGEGNFAIDFDKKQIGKVQPAQKQMPRVV